MSASSNPGAISAAGIARPARTRTTRFVNAQLCLTGQLYKNASVTISHDPGTIVAVDIGISAQPTSEIAGEGRDTETLIDLHGQILAPGFLELQTNGLRGFHFTSLGADGDGESTGNGSDRGDAGKRYEERMDEVAGWLVRTGVTGFWATIPTVGRKRWGEILPHLRPRAIPFSASLLGAHVEGPYLSPLKAGAHTPSHFCIPSADPIEEIYGPAANDSSIVKFLTLAPELSGSTEFIQDLVNKGIVVSLGHSNATFSEGRSGVQAGATCLTHVCNAMAAVHHREPGLAGLVTLAPHSTGDTEEERRSQSQSPYFSVIPDGHHLHPSMVTLLFRANPERCILITDAIELLGLPDGTYPGNSQISSQQTKIGSRVVKTGTETLIGGCANLNLCVRNLMLWSGCKIAEAVRCVTENVAGLMGDASRGKLEVGRRADLVVLDERSDVVQTWVGGERVWESMKGGV